MTRAAPAASAGSHAPPALGLPVAAGQRDQEGHGIPDPRVPVLQDRDLAPRISGLVRPGSGSPPPAAVHGDPLVLETEHAEQQPNLVAVPRQREVIGTHGGTPRSAWSRQNLSPPYEDRPAADRAGKLEPFDADDERIKRRPGLGNPDSPAPSQREPPRIAQKECRTPFGAPRSARISPSRRARDRRIFGAGAYDHPRAHRLTLFSSVSRAPRAGVRAGRAADPP